MKHKITGDIDNWNDSIIEFWDKMKSVKEDEDIELAINSYGGDAFLGVDISNALKEHPGNVNVTVTGIAASAASVIAMGGDSIKIYENAMLMIHNALTFALGNAADLRKTADMLDKVSASIMKSYSRAGNDDTIKQLMDDETFLSASEAKQYGLVDEVISGEKAEKVESRLFQNKADEFNKNLQSQKVAASLDEETVKRMFAEFKQELKNELKPQEPQPNNDPKPEPAKNLSKLFLNINKSEGK